MENLTARRDTAKCFQGQENRENKREGGFTGVLEKERDKECNALERGTFWGSYTVWRVFDEDTIGGTIPYIPETVLPDM